MTDGKLIIVEESRGYRVYLLDVDFEIAYLPVGQYAIHIDLLEGTSTPIEFTVDLESQPSGIYCVD